MTMTMSTNPSEFDSKQKKSRPVPPPRNGVDTNALFATIGVVQQQPELGKFQFRAENRWIAGTHSQTTIQSFSGAGAEHDHLAVFRYDSDHPAVLTGKDQGPTPVEFLLLALASCLMSGVANIAAARGVTLTAVTAKIDGDIDLRAILGLTDDVRNGYEKIRVSFEIEGDAPPEKLRAIVEQSRARSAVFDVVTNGVPVEVSIDAK
jgi:uncharacterized OsmC-like protein